MNKAQLMSSVYQYSGQSIHIHMLNEGHYLWLVATGDDLLQGNDGTLNDALNCATNRIDLYEEQKH